MHASLYTCSRLLLSALLFAVGGVAHAAEATTVVPPEGAPVLIPRAKQYDLTSRINGRTYRVFVATPFKADPAKKYPVMYLLDGNWYFGPAAINATESAGARTIEPAIIVGIGYPTEDNDLVGRRRAFELTPSATAAQKEHGEYGGGDAFLQVVEEEIKPFVAAHYAIDPTRQILYGKSFGGLAVLRQMFRNPTAYATYVIASPAIAWNDRDILKDEPGFAQRAKAGELNLRLLLLAAGNEQYRGPDPKLRAQAERSRMIDNAMELADRLAALSPQKVVVEKAIIPDEDHVSVSLAELGRALHFALKR